MTVVSNGIGRIKVILTCDDVDELGISVEDMDCSDPDTRLLLRALFKAAAEKIGIKENTDRLLIEAYPHLGGGGVLYFTVLENKHTGRLKIKGGRVCEYILKFSDGGMLLSAIELLFSDENTKALPSRLYAEENAFVLVIKNNENTDLIYLAAEFCDEMIKREHHTVCEGLLPLSGEYAVKEIGEKLITYAKR